MEVTRGARPRRPGGARPRVESPRSVPPARPGRARPAPSAAPRRLPRARLPATGESEPPGTGSSRCQHGSRSPFRPATHRQKTRTGGRSATLPRNFASACAAGSGPGAARGGAAASRRPEPAGPRPAEGGPRIRAPGAPAPRPAAPLRPPRVPPRRRSHLKCPGREQRQHHTGMERGRRSRRLPRRGRPAGSGVGGRGSRRPEAAAGRPAGPAPGRSGRSFRSRRAEPTPGDARDAAVGGAAPPRRCEAGDWRGGRRAPWRR